MITREATPEEVNKLTEMAQAMHAESDFAAVKFDYEFCKAFVNEVVTLPDHLALVAEEDGNIYGAFLGLVAPFFFSPVLRFADIALYVVPEKRGSSIAIKLEHHAEAWAKKHNAVRGYRGVTTGNKMADEFYKRLGYTEIGGFYRKDYGQNACF